ncbi:MAG: hypothetical protein H6622_00105 [Halobacteriovoraceae bacterium]|nr:hypothetical protein [Halobacteriovoraceae bacterium]
MKAICEISIGELLDKYSILDIKREKITDPIKLQKINKEWESLRLRIEELALKNVESSIQTLREINLNLWNIEDEIRSKEALNDFDEEFIRLARSVYITNDKRFELKNRINQTFSSKIQEVKSYF